MGEENPGPGRTPEEEAEPADVQMMGDDTAPAVEAEAPAYEAPAEGEPEE